MSWFRRRLPEQSFLHSGDMPDFEPDQMVREVNAYLAANPRTDPRDALVETMTAQVAVLNDIIATQASITNAARHLMNVFVQRSASGQPMFKLNDAHDDAGLELIRHAILDLQAQLDGTEPPLFCLPTDPERIH